MLEITGRIESVIFHNSSNHYFVGTIKEEKSNQKYRVVGNMVDFNEYDVYQFVLEEVVHPTYGKQYSIFSVSKVLVSEKDMIVKYLSCPLFKGIGEILASRIVEVLGNDALELIRKDRYVLDSVKGMSQAKRDLIFEVLNQNQNQEVIEFLMQHGLGMANIGKIITFYKNDILDTITNNPYTLVDDIDGIGFSTADKFALSLGFKMNDPLRISYAIVSIIKDTCFKTGNTYLEKDEIHWRFSRMIQSIEKDDFLLHLNALVEEEKIIEEQECYFVKEYYFAEKSVAKNIKRFIDQDKIEDINIQKIEESISSIQKQTGIVYDEIQIDAIQQFFNHSFLILTGGPGTGKTTIINGILKTVNKVHPDKKITLTAPTGRASKRMKEVTGYQASTIHRLLKWDAYGNKFEYNQHNPLEGDILIVDEFSMVDTSLFAALLNATIHFEKIILVGDQNQLPSVSPGNVLKDLIDSDLFHIIALKKIFRQSNQSGIIELAHMIQEESFNFSIFDEYQDIHFIETSKEEVKDKILEIADECKFKNYDQNDIQVLAPIYKGQNGVIAMNLYLQNFFNPKQPYLTEIVLNQVTYRKNDKILQLKNRTEDDIYNGDIGKLDTIEKRKDGFPIDQLYVEFDDKNITYVAKDFDTITHAYCMTVHKSQGSEFKIVILPMDLAYSISLRKKLIYTAMTRAKHQLYIVGSKQAFLKGINNLNEEHRKTKLLERLKESINENTYHDIDEISPYDFM